MHGKTLLCAAALALLAPLPMLALDAAAQTAPAQPQNPLTPQSLDMARGILAVTLPPEHRRETFVGMMNTMAQQMIGPALQGVTDAGLRRIATDHINSLMAQMTPLVDQYIPGILEAQAHAYAREFSLAELTQIRAFAGTPGGQHFLSRSSALLRDPEVAAANQAFFAKVQQMQQARIPELVAKLKDYVAKHPEAMPKQP